MRAARNAGHNRAFGTMLSLVAFGISCCTPAFGLSPTRASQLVTLEAESQSTGCAGNGQTLFFAIRKQQNGLPAAFPYDPAWCWSLPVPKWRSRAQWAAARRCGS
jgi:hypothetical protein